MEDSQFLKHITKLTAREEELWTKTDLSVIETAELHRLKLQLDQSWDLLRQRRALRDAGKNPDKAAERDIDTIENYGL